MPARKNGRRKVQYDSDVRYIPCQIEPGMFRDEWLVSVQAVNRNSPQSTTRAKLFVDNELVRFVGTPVRGRPVAGWLRVYLSNLFRNFADVVLPQPAQPIGTRMRVAAVDLKKEG